MTPQEQLAAVLAQQQAPELFSYGNNPDLAGLPPRERSLVEYHRYNLANNPMMNEDGRVTTAYLTGLQGPGGREYVVPGYVGGRRLSPEEVRRFASAFGWDRFPSYPGVDSAEAATQRIHGYMERDTLP